MSSVQLPSALRSMLLLATVLLAVAQRAASDTRLPGLSYAAHGATGAFCLPDADVESDVLMLARITQRIRIYGVSCNNTHTLLRTAERASLQVLLGVWLSADLQANEAEMSALEALVAAWGALGTRLILAVSVGNELLSVNGGSLVGLLEYLDRARRIMQLYPSVPIAYVDIPSVWLGTHSSMNLQGQALPSTPPARAGMLSCPATLSAAQCALLQRVDMVGVNLHPFHEGLPPSCTGLEEVPGCYDGPSWVMGRLADVRRTLNTSKVLLTEVGWPSSGEACCSVAPYGLPANATFLAVPSPSASAIHLTRFYAAAEAAGEATYFYFSGFDDRWKQVYAPCYCAINPLLQGCGAGNATKACTFEYHWGLLDASRQPKPGLDLAQYTKPARPTPPMRSQTQNSGSAPLASPLAHVALLPLWLPLAAPLAARFL